MAAIPHIPIGPLVSWAECYTTPRLLRSLGRREFIESFSRTHPREHQRKIFRTNVKVLAHLKKRSTGPQTSRELLCLFGVFVSLRGRLRQGEKQKIPSGSFNFGFSLRLEAIELKKESTLVGTVAANE
jgi:hypothetical protein